MTSAPDFRPLTPDLIPAFVDLFGPRGACGDCWCTLHWLKPRQRTAARPGERRALMLDRIRRGPPPGLLAMAGAQALGWMQIGPRADVPEWNNPGRLSAPLPDTDPADPAAWAITCFFFRRAARGQGLSQAFLRAGIAHARAQGARIIESAPMDRSQTDGGVAFFVGTTSSFLRAGFAEVARRRPTRPLMRLDLATPSLSRPAG